MSRFQLKDDFTWKDFLFRTGLIIVTVALVVWFMPRDGRGNFNVEIGKPWKHEALAAPFDFPVYKSEKVIQNERDSVLQLYEPYYNYRPSVEDEQIKHFVEDFKKGIPGLSNDYISIIANRLHRLYQHGIVNNLETMDAKNDSTREIHIVNGKLAVNVKASDVYTSITAYEALLNDSVIRPHREVLQKCDLNTYIEPNLIFDKDRSEVSKNELLNSIPLANGIEQRGQKIIDRGEIVDETTYNIIESFKKEFDRRHSTGNELLTTILGQALYVFVLIFMFTLYLSLFREDYFEKARSIAMLYSLIILFSIITSLMVEHGVLHVYIIPYAMVPIFVRVFMDSRTAFMTQTVLILICACILQRPLDFIALELCAAVAAISSLRELSSRSQLFQTAILVAVTGIVVNLSIDLIHTNDFNNLEYREYNYLVLNGLLLFCSYPLLYVIEKLFGFVSNITLIELSDMSKDLLRRMSEVAPGTFQHSIQVGNLAAEIANKIDAKAQLVRTGALYHDIGKINNPIYYTENQSGVNPHENISEIESAQMIISHVTEGLKLADKYDLPNEIKDFISTHHGLGKAKFFYINYKNAHPDEDVDELLFTYPGPNPFTKEQAILMMADSVEAASRSLPDYTERSIRDLVDRIIDSQVNEGYFRDCPITFRDIAYAKTVLIEKLKTIYHTRVNYPEMKK